MQRIALITLTLLVVTAGMAAAQTSNMLNTPHDLSSSGPIAMAATNVDQICVFCHTPHQAAAANGQPPLWNHQFPAAVPTYGVYDSTVSPTMDATPTEVGAAVGAASVSMLCMSCHDGTVGVGSLYNNPNGVGAEITPDNNGTMVTGNPNVGTDLTNDHPVNFTYTDSSGADTGIIAPASVDWVDGANTVPLFAGTVQCASCHDPHDNTNLAFLVKANTGSALCVTCHDK